MIVIPLFIGLFLLWYIRRHLDIYDGEKGKIIRLPNWIIFLSVLFLFIPIGGIIIVVTWIIVLIVYGCGGDSGKSSVKMRDTWINKLLR